MNSRVYCFLVIFFFLMSCKKKSLDVPAFPLPYSIEIGNIKEMKVNTIDSVFVGGFGNPQTYCFDINNDGEYDIGYYTSLSGSPGMGHAPVHGMSLMNNNISFMGTPYDDTTFFNKDTTFYYPGGTAVEMLIYSRYYHSRKSLKDTIVSFKHDPFKVKVFSPSEILKQSDHFADSSTFLMNYNIDHFYNRYISNDTTSSYYYNYHDERNPFPANKEIYFGFRIKDNGLLKLGWIKFIYWDDGTKAKIIETAIQKN